MSYELTDDDWLEQVERVLTPNVGGTLNPKYIVLHSTMGWPAALAIERWTTDNFEKESMHLLVGKDTSIKQLASFTTKVFHCGASYHQGHHGLNNWAIGVAIEGRTDESFFDIQLHTLTDVLQTIVEGYNIRDIVRHDDVSHGVNDLGYKFDIDRFKPLVRYSNADAEGRYAVIVPNKKKLNVRGGPDVRFEVIDTLNAGDGVKVLRFDFEWAYITYDTDSGNKTGWVHESFLRRL